MEKFTYKKSLATYPAVKELNPVRKTKIRAPKFCQQIFQNFHNSKNKRVTIKMKTMTILIISFIGLLSLKGCKKDTETICENLAEQGITDSMSIKGDWEFQYFAKTNNGNKITNKESISSEKWIGFDSNNISGGICNVLGGNYSLNSANNISISINSTTFKLCDAETNELESKLLKALNNAQCFVIHDNELIIHYSGDKSSNILLLTKK